MIRRTQIKRSAKPIKKISDKRRKEMAIYSEKRRLFLAKFFLCQIALAEMGFDHTVPPVRLGDDLVKLQLPKSGNTMLVGISTLKRSTEIHHCQKRGKNYLNEDTWLACSRFWHRAVESRKSWARERGYLA